jgi:mannitol/fructose-specific phosphotransferase system IIA component (Ntr-type)
MNLARFLAEDRIDLTLDEAFDEERPASIESLAVHMAGLLESSDEVVNATKLRIDLVNREKRAPSLLGQGIAMPHVRTLQARKLIMAVGISRAGLPGLPTPDEMDVHMVVALGGPPYDDRLYLQVYRRLAERVSQDDWVERILATDQPGEIVRALSG